VFVDFIFIAILMLLMSFAFIHGARASGWNELSKCYRGQFKGTGKPIKFASARLKDNMFAGCILKLNVDERYVYFAFILPFNLFFKSIAVPIEDIEINKDRSIPYFSKQMTFKQCPDCPIRISKRNAILLGLIK